MFTPESRLILLSFYIFFLNCVFINLQWKLINFPSHVFIPEPYFPLFLAIFPRFVVAQAIHLFGEGWFLALKFAELNEPDICHFHFIWDAQALAVDLLFMFFVIFLYFLFLINWTFFYQIPLFWFISAFFFNYSQIREITASVTFFSRLSESLAVGHVGLPRIRVQLSQLRLTVRPFCTFLFIFLRHVSYFLIVHNSQTVVNFNFTPIIVISQCG